LILVQIDYLANIWLFGHNFEPETPESQSLAQKTRIKA